jgi:hypothetical protein
MVYTIFDGATWAKEVKLKGQLASAPSCATLHAGRVLCAARSATGGLTSTVFSGTTWSAFDSQPANITSEPGCSRDDNAMVICAMRDTTGKILVNRYNGSSWDGFLNISGLASEGPICTNLGLTGQVACFARGTDLALWGARFNGGAWSTAHWSAWGSLGGSAYSKASCGVIAANQIVCGVIALGDSGFYVDQFNGSNWGGFVGLGQTSIGNPSCTLLDLPKVICTVVGVNNKVQSTVGP